MEVNDLLNSRIPWMDGWMDLEKAFDMVLTDKMGNA